MPSKSLHNFIKPHSFISHFKGFKNDSNKSSQTPGSFYSLSNPQQFNQAKELCYSQSLLDDLQLEKLTAKDIEFLSGSPELAQQPFVTRYGGHQFGHWAGQLGDGRAHTVGQLGDKWDVQIKGSGPSPYSRSGDGYAVLRSSLREFLMSEYMHHLGVPTTRALNLMTTGESVLRDMFYDGNAAYEDGALVTRLAPSFIRFGHFQIFAQNDEVENLKQLVDWTVENHFPKYNTKDDGAIFEWFDHICTETLGLVVHWMRVGFVHGVLNTDNMSVHSLTIDYGPFSMLDEYDRSFTPNTTDLPGRRYSFENQPAVCLWNLERLANALSPLTSDTSGFIASLEMFKTSFRQQFEKMFQNKLGLPADIADSNFIRKTEQHLQDLSLDYTLFFLSLQRDPTQQEVLNLSYKSLSTAEEKSLIEYFADYKKLLGKMNAEEKNRLQLIQKNTNPVFNLRNYVFVEILDELKNGANKKLQDVMKALEQPYSKLEHSPYLYQKRPDWAKGKAGCTLLSCSS